MLLELNHQGVSIKLSWEKTPVGNPQQPATCQRNWDCTDGGFGAVSDIEFDEEQILVTALTSFAFDVRPIRAS